MTGPNVFFWKLENVLQHNSTSPIRKAMSWQKIYFISHSHSHLVTDNGFPILPFLTVWSRWRTADDSPSPLFSIQKQVIFTHPPFLPYYLNIVAALPILPFLSWWAYPKPVVIYPSPLFSPNHKQAAAVLTHSLISLSKKQLQSRIPFWVKPCFSYKLGTVMWQPHDNKVLYIQ